MATILLSAVGAAVGSSIGGSVMGLSMMAVGRFVGASVGRALDQRLMGQGSETLETGRIDRFRMSGAGEGTPIGQVFGRMRVGAHVIWATEFVENVKTRGGGGGGGGKGAPSQPKVKEYSYSVSVALALCEGEISSVSRVWADGAEIALSDLNMRVYTGAKDQQPDPKIEAVEGAGATPAYRGTAYVVIEDLDLQAFGNRVPQFSFEVCRPDLNDAKDVPLNVKGVAVIPGTGEYALATEPVYIAYDGGAKSVANVNSTSETPDFTTSMQHLAEELPNCEAASLVVSWFGDDLRCGSCTIRPKVEQSEHDGAKMPWRVSGLNRNTAALVPSEDGRPVYGGTPTDVSVVQAIRKMTDDGLAVMYYPFILMDQMAGNGLPDPWGDGGEQPVLPWRGRITLDLAPGQAGSVDGTPGADAQVAAFFGTASASDFTVGDGVVSYNGPDDWGYRRFILHQAALCAAAGGVEAFCIGSEMVSLTQIRGQSGFPAVDALQALAGECRALLGAGVKIGYAADWTEYFGYHPQDGSGDAYFHLDPLWADPEIDFIGIDNYMPISDWRDGDTHADAAWGDIYNPDYLRANVAGGEGYDWYYADDTARAEQIRSAITDGAHGEPWVWRYKDIRNWWLNPHHNRIGGVRQGTATAWVPQSKPVWFTELGCAAVDKATNQPNKFVDPKSSESTLPNYSNGLRDETIQRQYLRVMHDFWRDPANNPVSSVYAGDMLNMDRAFVWAWDARPFPWFPGNSDLWSDGGNYRRGHWLNGRTSSRALASVVAEICGRAGLSQIDTSALFGTVRGYVSVDVTDARRALQPLMLAYGFDAVEREGVLSFRMRRGHGAVTLEHADLAVSGDADGDLIETRASEADMAGRVRVSFVEADGDHTVVAEETVLPDETIHTVAETDLPLALTRAEGRQTAERWLSEARIARDTLKFSLPLSHSTLGAGDIVRLPTQHGATLARIDRAEVSDKLDIEAVRIDPDSFFPSEFPDEGAEMRPVVSTVPVTPIFLDLPLMRGEEVPHAPHLALTSDPWSGAVAVYDGATDADYELNSVFSAQSTVGVTQSVLAVGTPGLIDHGNALEIRLFSGSLQSVSDQALLAGANLMAIGDGTPDGWELFQFRDAELVGDGVWHLRHRLRGQAGSDGSVEAPWPEGSTVVLMNGAPAQIDLAAAQRGLERHFQIGPAKRFIADPIFVKQVATFQGNGLKPYRPAHLRAQEAGGDLDVHWTRRTRIDGDAWGLSDVPLGEGYEAYVVQVLGNGSVLRQTEVQTAQWIYPADQRAADLAAGAETIAVAQISDRFGPGAFARLDLAL